MIRAVLDTNVVVSALIAPAGLEDRVLKLGLHGFVQLYLSAPVLAEYERVLSSPKFGFRPARIHTTLRHITACAHLVQAMRKLNVCPDEEDNQVLECADAAGADFLITGNKRHFPVQWKQIAVLNAREFLELAFPSPKLARPRPKK